MLRRNALAALTLGGIAGLAACRDAFPLAPSSDAAPPDLDEVPDDHVLRDHWQERTITGGGGCQLHVVDTGNRHGQPILFLHGFSQNLLSWSAQLDSALLRRYRLVAMDLRGHGASDRPTAGYDDSKLWADDIDAVIRELALDQPVLCGWSYGPLVILDYVRHYGEARVGGLHFIDGLTKLGSADAVAVLTPEFLALVPGFFSTGVETSVHALEALLRMCFSRTPSSADLYTMLGFNVSVPPFVRQALFARTVDNDDLLPTIRKPVLITHGAADAVVKREIVDQIRQLLPAAQVDIMPNAGHAPFADDPTAFNRRLASFAEDVARARARSAERA